MILTPLKPVRLHQKIIWTSASVISAKEFGIAFLLVFLFFLLSVSFLNNTSLYQFVAKSGVPVCGNAF